VTSKNQQRPNERQTIAVFGASGHTGRFVITELLRRGFSSRAIGRDIARLAASDFVDRGVDIRSARTDDPVALDKAIAGASAVINCAGPFLDSAEAIAAAALRARVHYFDITAEQPSAQATLMKFDASARATGIVVVPAMGFYGGLGDILATAVVGDWNIADDIRIVIGLDSWHPTLGTRKTGQRNTSQRLVIADGKLQPLPQPASEMPWNFPEPLGRQTVIELPFSETVLIARHIRTSHLHNYINQAALQDIRNAATPPPTAADASGRSAQIFTVEVTATNGDQIRRVRAHGRDIYAFTAPLVCEAVERIVAGTVRGGGAFAPGELFDARAFLAALVERDELDLEATGW
jgi:short subunit dehydrogenase-like uncharacterized protein